MLIKECTLPKTNDLVTDYLQNDQKANSLFQYDYTNEQAYITRQKDLRELEFPREELANHLEEFNAKFTNDPKVFENIQKLKANDSTVVITGQQAGLLTGPLYTIYKAISTIQQAKQLEKVVNSPVIPVFWVAGEDHDFQEINHTWVTTEGKMKKEKFPQQYPDKRPVSEINFQQKEMEKWVKNIFEAFGESAYSKDTLQVINDKIRKSQSMTDFFIHIMVLFFDKHGLVFIDSHSSELRNIESPYFHTLISKNDELRSALDQQQKKIIELQYPSSLDIDSSCAHLFYHHEDDRELLYKGGDFFHLKDKGLQFSPNELSQMCEQYPERLSNNVVTRPLMQDYLFPTIAFVAGPGEITYWAQLKPLFQVINRKMPPIVPRMHVTLIERDVDKLLERFELSLEEVLDSGVQAFREKWLRNQKGPEAEETLNEARQHIDNAHEKIRKFAWNKDHNLGQIAEKNRQLILAQIDYMEHRIEKMYEQQYSTTLTELDVLEAKVNPNDGLQERIWNVCYFISRYGFEFVDQLFTLKHTNKPKHYAIYL